MGEVTAFVALDMLAFAVLAVVSVVVVVPWCNTSKFRYRLWRIRDVVFDELRRGEYEDSALATTFVDFLENMIRFSGEFTAFRMALTRASMRQVVPEQPELKQVFPFLRLDECCDGDRELLTRHVEEFARAAVRHLALGTPSGWGLTILSTPVGLAFAFVDFVGGRVSGRSIGTAVKNRLRQELRDELRSAPDFVYFESRSEPNRDPLHNLV